MSATQLVRENPTLAGRSQMVSIFPAPFDLMAVEIVSKVDQADALIGLSWLAGRSLVLYDADTKDYRLHDLLREVARYAFVYGGMKPAAVRQSPRLEIAASRHAKYCGVMAGMASLLDERGGNPSVAGLRVYDALLPHLQATWDWMRGRSDDEALEWVSDVAAYTASVRHVRVAAPENLEFFQAALQAARRLRNRTRERLFLSYLGTAYGAAGDRDGLAGLGRESR